MALPSGTGSGAYNAGDETDRQSRLFPRPAASPLATEHYSHIFFVVDAPIVLRAYDLPENAIACVEMVTGCKEGDTFAPLRIGGECWCICPCSNTLVVPWEGRYRVKLIGANPDEVTITAIRTSINIDLGSILAMAGGCPTPFDPIAAAAALAASGPAMDILSSALLAQDVASVLVSDPLALATLCTGLTPCIDAVVAAAAHVPAVVFGNAVIPVSTGGVDDQTFTLGFSPLEAANAIAADTAALLVLKNAFCVFQHAPAQILSPNGSVSVTAGGQDGQTFELEVNQAGLFPSAATPPVTNDQNIPTTFYGAGANYLRPDGFLTVAGKRVPFVN